MYPIQGDLVIDDHFDDGDELTGREATDLTAKFLNDVQDEILNAVEAGGQAPSPDDQQQLAKAIAKRCIKVFKGSTDALDPNTGLASGLVSDAIVILQNSGNTLASFQFPAAAGLTKLGLVIVIPDWSGSAASSPTASITLSQASGTTLPIFNGNIAICAFDGTGYLNAAKVIKLPMYLATTLLTIGRMEVQENLNVHGASTFTGGETHNGESVFNNTAQFNEDVTGDNAYFTTINSSGLMETSASIGNKVSKPFLMKGFRHDSNQLIAGTIDYTRSLYKTSTNVNLRALASDLMTGGCQRLVIYNDSSSSIQVTYNSDKTNAVVKSKGCCEFLLISGTAGAYEWASLSDWSAGIS